MIDVLGNILLVIVLLTLVVNLFNIFKESKQLKAQGKTPLVRNNVVIVFVAALAEYVVITLLIAAVFDWCHVKPTTMTIVITFTAGYILRNVGAYLAAWGTLSIFMIFEKRKMKKEIAEENKTAL